MAAAKVAPAGQGSSAGAGSRCRPPDDVRGKLQAAMQLGAASFHVWFRDLSAPDAIPEELWGYSGLTALVVNSCNLPAVPDAVGRLTALTQLELGGNALAALPASLSQLEQLSKLGLSSNAFVEAPHVLSTLTRLQELNLAENCLSKLGSTLRALKSLTQLNLAHNNLKRLSKFGKLISLQTLNLSSNQLNDLPHSFAKLANLELLDLGKNALTAVPACLYKLSSLTVLDLSNNRITTFSRETSDTSDLGNDAANKEPIEINWKALTKLDLSDNKLSAFPLQQPLAALTKLELRGNQFRHFPRVVTHCTALASLSLESNLLHKVPSSLTRLSSLVTLDLSFNDLSRLPDFTSMTSLRFLRMTGNKVYSDADVAPSLPQSCRLTAADHSANEILPNLYLGSFQSARNKHKLQALGVTHILTVMRAEFLTSLYPEHFKYHVIPVDDVESTYLLAHFDECHKFIDEARDNNTGVLVHCGVGVSRSATIVISYVMRKLALTREEATTYVHDRRDIIAPNPGFVEQLEAFEGHLRRSNNGGARHAGAEAGKEGDSKRAKRRFF
eukprot:TRINITY_DN208_c3_g1_i1.p1 TRINITY_DN208_c3_g1~~TRINITY_DN208_c3_g1_i1.p1  ORF type:complete len:591 (+),score=113.36 TRINITY_DN208_c3_g1_i1:100-1773(+)